MERAMVVTTTASDGSAISPGTHASITVPVARGHGTGGRGFMQMGFLVRGRW